MPLFPNQKIISGDAHFVEPPDLFETRLPKEFRDRAPRTWKGELPDGQRGEFYIVDNLEPAPVAGSAGAGASNMYKANLEGYAAAPKSVWDPAERLKEQDIDSISAEVLFTSWGLFLFSLDDDRLREACFSVFNDWAAEYVAYDRDRMKGVGLCDLADVDNGVREIHRAAELGLSGVLISSGPEDERPYSSPEYDPFWAAAEELDLPIGMHVLTGRHGKGRIKYGTRRKDRPDPTPSVNYVTSVLNELQESLAHMISGGVFERQPKLRLILLEADVGWIPHFIYRMDHFRPVGKDFKRSAMDIFQTNIYSAVQYEQSNLEWLCKVLGPEHFMWSTDYPHFDCPFPHSRKLVNELFANFSPESAATILEEVPARLFGFDPARLAEPRVETAG
jgi:predicted TIM-barrel fold metal-dependent hydrolase